MQRQSMTTMETISMCCSDRHIRESRLRLSQQSHTVNYMDGDRVVMIEDVTTSGKSMEETVPKVRGAADVEIVGLMVSLNRMEVGQGGKVSALDEIKEKYGFEGKAIVTMAEVTEYLYNREHNGRVVINDEIKAAIDKYYEEYGCK